MMKNSLKQVLLLLTVFFISVRVNASTPEPTSDIVSNSSSVPDTSYESTLPSFRVTSLHQWMVDRMLVWSPAGVTYYKDAKETPEEGKTRYESIADDILSVAYDPTEKPIFGGQYGRAMTAALIAAVAMHESYFRKDVDEGIGPAARGDSGESWCIAQIRMGKPEADGKTTRRVVVTGDGLKFITDKSKTIGWGGEDLISDRNNCVRAAIRIARMSFNTCSKLPITERLALYASGDGSCTKGRDASKARVSSAQQWLAKRRPPLKDKEVLELLHPSTVQPTVYEVSEIEMLFPFFG
ncbi:MAG: hypothetical protein WC708_00910 [Lentisphaeria bacterium]|jgi:hypothetical protein